jgi:lipid II:glycine glycyltransferase (peptidoglycan interpeptide bridge formation enzyme)
MPFHHSAAADNHHPINGSEEDRLARMNQKTRYNIRLAQKKDLVIREENNVSAFMELMAETGGKRSFSCSFRRILST